MIELLLSQKESLSNEEMALVEREETKNTDETTKVPLTSLELIAKVIVKRFIEKGLQILVDNDPTSEHKIKF